MNFDTMPPVLEHIKAGKLRALAISTPQRLPQLPDVPTFAEVGIRGFDVTNWYSIMGPKGLPPDIVAKVNDAVQKSMSDPALRPKLEAQGVQFGSGTPDEFAAFIKSELDEVRAARQGAECHGRTDMAATRRRWSWSSATVAIATVVLNRPEKLNALTRSMWGLLGETIDALSADDALRCIVCAAPARRRSRPATTSREFATERVEQGAGDRVRRVDASHRARRSRHADIRWSRRSTASASAADSRSPRCAICASAASRAASARRSRTSAS